MASPTDRRYSDKHVWAKKDGDVATFGLTEYSFQKFGKISSVSNLSAIGTNLKQGDVLAKIDRSGSSDDFIAPMSGPVIDREDHNLDISDVNSDPYANASWFIQ